MNADTLWRPTLLALTAPETTFVVLVLLACVTVVVHRTVKYRQSPLKVLVTLVAGGWVIVIALLMLTGVIHVRR
jgi:hypothetical protein